MVIIQWWRNSEIDNKITKSLSSLLQSTMRRGKKESQKFFKRIKRLWHTRCCEWQRKRLEGNSMVWVQGPRNMRKEFQFYLNFTSLSRKEGPFADQNSEFTWNALNLPVIHNSIRSKLLSVENKHRKNAWRRSGLKMSFGNYRFKKWEVSTEEKKKVGGLQYQIVKRNQEK